MAWTPLDLFTSAPSDGLPLIFRWSLSDSKSPQVSRTLLSILAVLNNAVVWIVSTRLQLPNIPGPLIILADPVVKGDTLGNVQET